MVNCAFIAHAAKKIRSISIPRHGLLIALVALLGSGDNVAAQDWRTVEPMPSPRYGMAAVEVGGDIYVIGGRDRYGHGLASLLRYDPETDTWDTGLSPMNRPRVDPEAAVLNGKIYVIGGAVENEEAIREVTVYDPSANTWSQAGDLQHGRFGHRAIVIDDRIWVFGGRDDEGRLIGDVEVYDAERDSWELRDDWKLQNPRVSFALVAIGKAVYALFGYGSGGPIPAVEQFGPLSEVEELIQSFLLRGRLATVTVDETAYFMGGRAESDRVIDDVLMFTPAADNFFDRWRSGPKMLNPRESFAAVTVGNDIYAIGGRTEVGDREGVTLASMEVLSVATSINEPEVAGQLPFRLEQNHPNPFTNSTAIPLSVAGDSRERISLRVYDLRGRLVDTVFDGHLTPGRHEMTWTAGWEGELPSGTYFYELRQGESRQVRQMTYIR